MNPLNRAVGFSVAVVAAIFVFGCTSAPKKGEPIEDQPSPEVFDEQELGIELDPGEARLFKEIRFYYARGETKKAISKARQFKKRYPQSLVLERVENLYGLVLLSSRKNLQAINEFKKSLGRTKDETFAQYVLFNLASAEYESRRIKASNETLSKIDPNSLNASTRLKYHYLRSLVFARLKMPLQSAEEALAGSLYLDVLAGNMRERSKTEQNYRRQLRSSLKRAPGIETVETLFQQYEQSPIADVLLYRLAVNAKKSGKMGAAEFYLQTLISRYPQTEHYVDALNHLRQIQDETIVDQRAIGVLLPMTGRFAKFGNQCLQSISLAFRIFNVNEPGSQVTLYIEDSGETPEQAVAALDRLYFEQKVVAVIGPLLSRSIEAVSKRAEELGVPTVALSQKRGIPGDNLFYSSVTPKDQAHEIVRYAMETKGLKRFAILYPKDRFGQQYKESFWDAVEERGGEIVGVESYPSKETDFRVPVDKLTGNFYKGSRSWEEEELRKLREEEGITKRNRRTEQYYKLPPIVDFQGVFIPDEVKSVSQILPTFAYRDVEEVQYLGVATWNSPDLTKRAREYAEGALFTDSFFAQSSSPVTKDFVRRFRSSFRRTPGVLEALSYDAALLLERTLITQGDSVSRGSVRSDLQKIADFPGVTGKISYLDGQFKRQLKILTVEKSRIIEAL